MHVEAVLETAGLTVTARAAAPYPGADAIEVRHSLAGPFSPAKDLAAMVMALRGSFEKLGDTRLTLGDVSFTNHAGGFVPVSRLNALRRDVVAAVEAELQRAVEARAERVKSLVPLPDRLAATHKACADAAPRGDELVCVRPTPSFAWSLKVDRIGYVDAFEPADWEGVDEILLDIARDHPTLLANKLETLAATLGREHIRLALPPLTRKWEEKGILQKVQKLRAAGWNRWEAGNLSAWSMLERPPSRPATPIDRPTGRSTW